MSSAAVRASSTISRSPPSGSSSSSSSSDAADDAEGGRGAAASSATSERSEVALRMSDSSASSAVGRRRREGGSGGSARARRDGRRKEGQGAARRRTLRLEELHEGPDGDVAECRVVAREELLQVAAQAVVGRVPRGGEGRVVVGCGRGGRKLVIERLEEGGAGGADGTHFCSTGCRSPPPRCPAPRRSARP